VLIILRSILFNVLFYLNLVVLLVTALVTLALPRRAVLRMAELRRAISPS
jgi:1-acyl-sn-glycerol-3-phosphate acyltransferase